ncbi:Transcriptional regulator, LysR-family [Modestobacter italicus]|uniref:Transcriptional regulator, LysR-family n=1 Tax=Modestobacter italicus (strain DSM 44449 / CECT 9708 / BC 501) TaxID=2732864 RepID=I4EVM4_MODI5|nr:LysR family transcriptional regulator [Modestobacter marinus]CCH87437.1 Transcriptional regulator, LysR-family [Modestobacter marinus]
MELRQLEYFLAVVEEGSFTAAAARLYMVQSSLSASLLSLERELGTELFIRGRRGTDLTDAGRALLEPARAALADTGRARDAVAEVRGLLRGSVRIAAMAVPRVVDVVETIRRFQSEHPGVDVHVLPVGAAGVVDLVADGQVDFAIGPRTPRIGPALRFTPLVSTPLTLVCPAGHRLAGVRELTPADVLAEPVIDLARGWWTRALFDTWLQEEQQRRVRLEINDWLSLLSMVQRGMGVSYGPDACIDRDVFRGVATARLAGAPQWELGVITRDDTLRGAAGRAFLAAYLDQCRPVTSVR